MMDTSANTLRIVQQSFNVFSRLRLIQIIIFSYEFDGSNVNTAVAVDFLEGGSHVGRLSVGRSDPPPPPPSTPAAKVQHSLHQYSPRCPFSTLAAVIQAGLLRLLLLMAGIEPNPGPEQVPHTEKKTFSVLAKLTSMA